MKFEHTNFDFTESTGLEFSYSQMIIIFPYIIGTYRCKHTEVYETKLRFVAKNWFIESWLIFQSCQKKSKMSYIIFLKSYIYCKNTHFLKGKIQDFKKIICVSLICFQSKLWKKMSETSKKKNLFYACNCPFLWRK